MRVDKILPLLGLSLLIAVILYPIQTYLLQPAIKYDALGYYIYLPSFFIYHDWSSMTHASYLLQHYNYTHYFYQALRLPDGQYVFGYTMGIAMMELPFFLIAHVSALLGLAPADGYSMPYVVAVIWSGIFYGLLGSYAIYRLVSMYYNRTVAVWVIVLLLLGTNLTNYAFLQNGMGHVYSFCLGALLLYTMEWYFRTRNRVAIACAAWIFGMMLLIRPTNAIIILPALFIGFDGYRERLSVLCQDKWVLIGCSILAWVPFSMQMIYWHTVTGHFLFNPYAFAHLGFDFTHPKFLKGLFGIHRGWFVYTPIMLLAIFGLYWRNRMKIPNIIIGVFLFINGWIIFSWCVFDYGASFGYRPWIDCYALMAIPLAVGIEHVYQSRWSKYSFYVFAIFCMLYNLSHTYKFQRGILAFSGYNWYSLQRTFWNINGFGPPSSISSGTGIIEPQYIIKKQKIVDTLYINGKTLTKALTDIYRDTLSTHDVPNYLRLTVEASYGTHDLMAGYNTVLVADESHHDKTYLWAGIPIKLKDSTLIQGDFKLLQPFAPDDILKVFFYNPIGNKLCVKKVKVEGIWVKE